MDLFHETRAVIGKENPIEFEVKDGVRQGCPIGPILFVMVLGFLLWTTKLKFPTLKDLEFADDLTIIEESLEVLEQIFQEIAKEGPSLGLIVNDKKTDSIDIENGVMTKAAPLLGTIIDDNDDNWNNILKRNIEKARNVFLYNTNRVWKIAISTKLKIRILQTLCIPVLLYGLESLPLTAARLKKLDSCIYKMVKTIMRYKFDDNVSYKVLTDRIKDIGIDFIWPSFALCERMKKDFWHFFRHHPDYADICNDVDKKTKSRKFTLDQVVDYVKWTELKFPELNLRY